MKRQRVLSSLCQPGGVLAVLIVAAAALAGCRQSSVPAASTALRLTDLVEQQAAESSDAPPPTIGWRFDQAPPGPGGAAASGWQVSHGVAGLAIEDGRLVGESTHELPIIWASQTTPIDPPDTLHAIEVRLKVSAGSNLYVHFESAEEPELEIVTEQSAIWPWTIGTPILAGEEMRTYRLPPMPPETNDSASIRHVMLRPTDVPGARFEIESVRLIFRREYLASIPAGLSWQGLSEVFRETLVAQTPETLELNLRLPEEPWLDLALGTVDEIPVTFRVAVAPAGASEQTVLERTVTTPDRWETVAVDLTAFGGKEVAMSLALESEREGVVGLWGSPVVRNRGTPPVLDSSGAGAPEPPLGVILIVADTLRLDHLQVAGYDRETSPNLRRMAAEGVLFKDCQAQGTWTKASFPSLITSLHPFSHGVIEFDSLLPSSAVTLAEVYRDAGYATLSLSATSFTGRFTNMHQGFEELHESTSLTGELPNKTAREFVDRLLPWLETHRDVPFFVQLHLFDPHHPYGTHGFYNTLWADAGTRQVQHQRRGKVVPLVADPLLQFVGMPNREELVRAGIDPDDFVANDKNLYDASIRATDAEIGRLFGQLRTLGLDRRTVVVFVSDHGEEFLDHGGTYHGQSVYGELSNVPLIFWGPGRVPEGAVVEPTVQTIDIMPTLLKLSRLPVPETLQGQNLLPLTELRERPAFTTKAAISHIYGPPPRDQEMLAVVMDGWKLIHNSKRPDGVPEFELYRQAEDPLQRHDVAAEEPEVVERLAQILADWRKTTEGARLKSDDEMASELSAEELQRLRSLGYIQ